MELLQPHFPNSAGGRVIYFLRIAKSGDDSYVAKVNDRIKKYAEIIARCRPESSWIDEGCYKFFTTIGDSGHRELCQLLQRNGIRGRYVEWLEAVENGNESWAEEKESLSEISFDCDPIEEEEASRWRFKLAKEFLEEEMISQLDFN